MMAPPATFPCDPDEFAGGETPARARPRGRQSTPSRDLFAAGPVLADENDTLVGNLIILDTEDHAEVDAFIVSDPYTQGGLFESVAVSRWRKVFLGGERLA